mmetsp:Transcript_6634/g.9804  ORF Transcript_6634/g.9804 Transcript_6634/m.9804 type:complete len:373 (+) Transcript_6634:8-1126(+)
MPEISSVSLYGFMLGLLISGTAKTVVMKAMDLIKVHGSAFKHPYFQSFTLFLGEFVCLCMFMLIKHYKKHRIASSEALIEPDRTGIFKKLGKWVFCFSAAFELFASSLMFMGLVLSAASVFQMIRGFVVVVVAIYSKIFLKRSLFRHQILGMVSCTIGVFLVGLASILYEAPSARNPVLGVVLLLLGQLFAGAVFVTEELFMEKLSCHPAEAVGMEGFIGIGYCIILLPVLNLIPCHDKALCSHGKVENSLQAFKMLGDSPLLLMLWFVNIVSFALFHWTGVTTTRNASALARSTVQTSCTLLIWIVSMILGWEDFIWIQLIGFLILVLGTLVYNEVLILPWWGFKEAVLEHKNQSNKSPGQTTLNSFKLND